MQATPDGILLLYKDNQKPYTIQSYSTTTRLFAADPLLHPQTRVFTREAPLLDPVFQVDYNLL